ncbi:hypothetical protein [uncultured Stenotrophomonas sp.]|uniref:hypothetical protein n=1 Tax=uncultured Stenotrophomonas sp. TaxID=165438 RepID=UPI0028E55F74|nr:hypothetical protein [uncultured Stenotrophomonas sp.]
MTLNLHDWTLLDVRVDWALGTVEIHALDPASSVRRLVFESLVDVLIDRREPWGSSNSINEVTWNHDGEALSVKIELQSGGGVRITAGSCNLDGAECIFRHGIPGI